MLKLSAGEKDFKCMCSKNIMLGSLLCLSSDKGFFDVLRFPKAKLHFVSPLSEHVLFMCYFLLPSQLLNHKLGSKQCRYVTFMLCTISEG